MDKDGIKDEINDGIVKNTYLWIILKNGQTWEWTRVKFKTPNNPSGLDSGTQWCYYEDLDEKSLKNDKIVFKKGKSPHIIN